MSYLEQLISENTHQGALPKLTKGGFGSFDSTAGRDFLEKRTPTLPPGCPLLGNPVPGHCRFEPKFFQRMTREGVLSFGGQCPIRGACKL
jgi:hypothetical protein